MLHLYYSIPHILYNTSSSTHPSNLTTTSITSTSIPSTHLSKTRLFSSLPPKPCLPHLPVPHLLPSPHNARPQHPPIPLILPILPNHFLPPISPSSHLFTFLTAFIHEAPAPAVLPIRPSTTTITSYTPCFLDHSLTTLPLSLPFHFFICFRPPVQLKSPFCFLIQSLLSLLIIFRTFNTPVLPTHPHFHHIRTFDTSCLTPF